MLFDGQTYTKFIPSWLFNEKFKFNLELILDFYLMIQLSLFIIELKSQFLI